jgi:hypothetical protein
VRPPTHSSSPATRPNCRACSGCSRHEKSAPGPLL